MTAQRQERNRSRSGRGFCPGMTFIASLAGLVEARLEAAAIIFIFVGLGLQIGLPAAAQAATTERVVVNRFSGLAIEGFDPVAYFVDRRAVIGFQDFEASEAGAVWRFRNDSNRASFVARPDIYGPQFGGYDPIDLARGVAVAGNPRFWLVSGERLYLFGREQNRDAFAADPQHFYREASSHWPDLEQNLAQ
jgi:hypothetical protein